MPTILITRPALTATQLIKKLEKTGYNTQLEPILTIEPLETLRPVVASNAPVIITSRSTLEVLKARRHDISNFLNHACYCVGNQTALEARAFGFTNVHSANGDGLALAQLIIQHEKKKGSVLHLCSAEHKPEPRATLQRAGWSVVPWPLYKAREAPSPSPTLCSSLKTGKIDAALFFSPRTAQTFVKLLTNNGLESCCTRLIAVGLSKAVCEVLTPLPWKNLLTAPSPTEEAILTLLLSSYPPP